MMIMISISLNFCVIDHAIIQDMQCLWGGKLKKPLIAKQGIMRPFEDMPGLGK